MEQIGIDRLTGLIAFARAASLGSYSAAARSLSISPSAVSKSIQRLEERLGLKLFHRTTRSLTLTPEGHSIFERAQGLLAQIEQIEQTAAAARSEPAGVLKVTASFPVGVHLLAPLLPGFRERYPKLHVDLRLSDHYVNLVEEGVDVAVRVGALSDSRLIARELARHRVCAFASPGYLQRRGCPRCPEDLMDHDCVTVRFQSSGQVLRWPFQMPGRILEILPHAHIVADAGDAVAAIVAAGGGIGLAPTYVAAQYVKRGELVPVLADYAVDRAAITALWPDSRRGSPNVEVFVRFLREHITSPAPWDEVIRQAANIDTLAGSAPRRK